MTGCAVPERSIFETGSDSKHTDQPMIERLNMIKHMTAWQCIGCGRIQAEEGCIGVCKDRKVELVYSSDYAALQKQLDDAQSSIAKLTAQLQQIVNTEPRNGGWERNYRALQDNARRVLTEVSPH